LCRNDNHEEYQSLLQRNQLNQQQSFSLSQPSFTISAMTNSAYREQPAPPLMSTHQQNQGIVQTKED
jgi:hypothetical protein